MVHTDWHRSPPAWTPVQTPWSAAVPKEHPSWRTLSVPRGVADTWVSFPPMAKRCSVWADLISVSLHQLVDVGAQASEQGHTVAGPAVPPGAAALSASLVLEFAAGLVEPRQGRPPDPMAPLRHPASAPRPGSDVSISSSFLSSSLGLSVCFLENPAGDIWPGRCQKTCSRQSSRMNGSFPFPRGPRHTVSSQR